MKTIGLVGLLTYFSLSACTTKVSQGEYNTKGSPSEATLIWNNALQDGDIVTAERYTSQSSTAYIQRAFGSLAGLAKLYETIEDGYKTSITDEIIRGNIAIVKYQVVYANGSISNWRDKLFYEDGLWKLAPQYAREKKVK